MQTTVITFCHIFFTSLLKTNDDFTLTFIVTEFVLSFQDMNTLVMIRGWFLSIYSQDVEGQGHFCNIAEILVVLQFQTNLFIRSYAVIRQFKEIEYDTHTSRSYKLGNT